MKLIRSFSILLMSMMSLFCSIAAAQDLSATRPRRVPDVNQQRQANDDATKLAYNDTASGTEPGLKVAVPWVALKKAEPQSKSRLTHWRPSNLSRPAQDPTPQPTIDVTREGYTVSGRAPDGRRLKLYVNDLPMTDTNPTDTISRAGVYTFRLTKNPLKANDKIQVSYQDDTGREISSEPTTVIRSLNPTRGSLVGLAPFGVVMSQQAEKFSQSDPFGGFVVGYTGPQRKRVYCESVDDDPRHCPDATLEQIRTQPEKIRLVAKRNWNVRVQGLFQSAARAAAAPEEMAPEPAEPGVSPQQEEGEEMMGESFIASRKSFDVEMHLWYEMPLLGSRIFWWGPYAAIGGSTALDENELEGEAIKKDDTTLDTDQATTSNDMDKYFEGGVIFNFYSGEMEDSNLYIQAILAYGNYEALADLRPESNTKHRFVGKLRVFPKGLNRNFFEEGVAAPLFGVELNAGRGEDQLKFFVGVTFNVTRLISGLRGQPPTQ